VPLEYLTWLLWSEFEEVKAQMMPPFRAAEEAEIERRRQTPPLPPPRDLPAHHPDLLVSAPKMEEVAMGASEVSHLRGCRFLKPPYLKPGRLRPYTPSSPDSIPREAGCSGRRGPVVRASRHDWDSM
jgi:hypothetical protein